jgi:hypothetical protein
MATDFKIFGYRPEPPYGVFCAEVLPAPASVLFVTSGWLVKRSVLPSCFENLQIFKCGNDVILFKNSVTHSEFLTTKLVSLKWILKTSQNKRQLAQGLADWPEIQRVHFGHMIPGNEPVRQIERLSG